MKKKSYIDYDLAVTFGKVLKHHRNVQLVSQVKLAEISNMKERGIRAIEHGQRMPSLQTFVDLVKALNLQPDEVMKEVMEMMTQNCIE